MEEVKNIEEEKEFCVYGHFYKNVIFYIGSGIYNRDDILRSRAYDFINRSKNWFELCEGNRDQVKVRIFLRTNKRQEALDFEEELTQYYFDHEAPLVNVNIGNHHGEETRRKMSLAHEGVELSEEHKRRISLANKGKKRSVETRNKISKNHAKSKKVLVINNEINEEKIFDSIVSAYKFISQKGYDKTKATLQNYLKKGKYTFNNNYTLEKIE